MPPAALGQEPAQGRRERVVRRAFHPQNGLPQPRMIPAQRDNRIEPQRGLLASRATIRCRLSVRDLAAATPAAMPI